MTDNDGELLAVLARIGISITLHPSRQEGWGWTIDNDKIRHDWQGPYATAAAASSAVLEWLVEYARKGLLCHHVHAAFDANATVPVDLSDFKPEWSRN